jgi:hypothetical protein
MKGKIQIVGEPGVPKKKNIASVNPQVILYGDFNPLKIAELIKKFEDTFGVKANGDFLIDETPAKLKPDYRKFERFNNDRFKRSR